MRNLRITQDEVIRIKSSLPITSSTWDPSSDLIIFTLGPTATQSVIELRQITDTGAGKAAQSTTVASWDAPCPLPDITCDEVLSLRYFPQDQVSCLILAGGDIVKVRHGTIAGEHRVEIVGSVDDGITAAMWSPDEELLAIATCANSLLFMAADFEMVARANFDPEDSKMTRNVSVGWGKAETQFTGKRTKVLKDPTMPNEADEGSLSEFDNTQTTISWRGDGAYVAINSITQHGPRRIIRIFTREGALDSVTEPVDGLEGTLSWKPTGNLLAGIQRLDNTVQVVFFERNGLRHGQFALDLSPAEARDWESHITISWNNDSSLLGVSYRDRLQIWTASNYHYYLKQEFLHTKNGPERQINAIVLLWHPEDPLRFMLFPRTTYTAGGEVVEKAGRDTEAFSIALRTVSLAFSTSAGSSISPYDFGTLVVIDGRFLRITPLRTANIPPPMALHDVELEQYVKDVAVNQTSSSIAALHHNAITIIDWNGENPFVKPHIRAIVPLLLGSDDITRQICCLGLSGVFVLFTNALTGIIGLHNVTKSRTYTIATAVTHSSIMPSITHTRLCAILNGKILELKTAQDEDDESALEQTVVVHLPACLRQVEVYDRSETMLAVSLTSTGILYAGERQLVKNCTSLLLTTSHLVFTTSNNLLKFIHLDYDSVLDVPPDEAETDERCRNMERGARLIAITPSTHAVTLQMPRGNLETIYPRALIHAGIRSNLQAQQYREAFNICRKHRVDLNIIYDFSPEQFLSDVQSVLEQLETVDNIDHFLSQINDGDTSKALHNEATPASSANSKISPVNPGKVNRICSAFLSVLETNYKTHSQNIITAYICMVPPNIETGLKTIRTLEGNTDISADAAIEHMCFLVDVNEVYDIALGLYDLDLALVIAQQSQKDPREYLPYLQELQNLGQVRRRFIIDNDLKRYDKALEHLKALESFEELKTYIQKHDLHKEALNLYRYEPGPRRELTRLHADFLNSRNLFKEAGIAYESVKDFTSALAAYRAATLWKQALPLALQIPLSAEEFRALAVAFTEALLESKSYHAASTIALDYLHDVEAAVRYLCKGFAPAEAIRIAMLRERHDLLSTVIDEGLRESAAGLTELAADCKQQVLVQTSRLRELREIKQNEPLRFYTGEVPNVHGSDLADNISLAPTSSSLNPSLFTRYGGNTRSTLDSGTLATNATRRTSKGRRREERKKARGKKGSVYEEEYLVNSMERLIVRVNESHNDAREVVEACLRRDMWEQARAVESAMVEVVAVLRERFTENVDSTGPVRKEDIESAKNFIKPREIFLDGFELPRSEGGRTSVKSFEKSGLIL